MQSSTISVTQLRCRFCPFDRIHMAKGSISLRSETCTRLVVYDRQEGCRLGLEFFGEDVEIQDRLDACCTTCVCPYNNYASSQLLLGYKEGLLTCPSNAVRVLSQERLQAYPDALLEREATVVNHRGVSPNRRSHCDPIVSAEEIMMYLELQSCFFPHGIYCRLIDESW